MIFRNEHNFEKIISGQIPADILYQDDLCIVIRGH